MKEKRKRYRYILSGMISPDETVSCYRLVAATMLRSVSIIEAVRITIPDDMELTKLSCDTYSTTEDPRLLRELEATPMIKINGVWKEIRDLWPEYPCYKWFLELRKRGLYATLSKRGYLNRAQYQAYLKEKEVQESG